METPTVAAYLATAATRRRCRALLPLRVSPTAYGPFSRRPTCSDARGGHHPAVLLAFLPSPDPGPIRWFAVFVIALLTWQGATSDYDVTRPIGPQRRDKAAPPGPRGDVSCFWPPVLLAGIAVYCGRLPGWRHHAMMPLRLLKAYLAWFVVTALLEPPSSASALLLVLGCVSLSHYVKPAWSKAAPRAAALVLGLAQPHSYLVASAYSWGWARFLRPRPMSGCPAPYARPSTAPSISHDGDRGPPASSRFSTAGF